MTKMANIPRGCKKLLSIIIIAGYTINSSTKNNDKSRHLRRYVPTNSDRMGPKGPVMKIIEESEMVIDDDMAEQLPTWSEVTRLYGPTPIMRGIETCPALREKNPGEERVLVAIGGMYNTGTNLLRKLLRFNCDGPEVRDQFWWKHSPVEWTHKREYLEDREVPEWHEFKVKEDEYVINEGESNEYRGSYFSNVLSVVVIKDPFFWMTSMCQRPYAVTWAATGRFCPNLVPSVNTPYRDPLEVDVNVDVKVLDRSHPEMAPHQLRYRNLVDFWNRFNEGHLNVPYPHLMVRYEDLLFHPEITVQKVCDCAKGQMRDKFNHLVEPSKKGQQYVNEKLGPPRGLVDALLKYGSPEKRVKGFTEADVRFAREALNLNMMHQFNYILPNISEKY